MSAREVPVTQPEPASLKPEMAAVPEASRSELDVTLVVPVLTADGHIGEVLAALGDELDRLNKTWECVAVFDGCRGPAWEEALRLSGERPGTLRMIGFQQSFGQAACLSKALEYARGEVIVTSPQYLQIDPHEIGLLLATIDGGADFAVPWRDPRIDPWLNRVQSALFNMVMRRIIGAPFHDLNCYFRAIRREVLVGMAIYGDMYRFLPVIVYRQGFQVEEVRVRHMQEWGGAAWFGVGVYVRRLLDILGVVFLTHFTLKPLRFFGSLGALFALGGSGVLASLLLHWFVTGSAGDYLPALFLVGILLLVLGVQVIGFGLVGEIIIYTQARNLREYRIERVFEK
ncbi:MAG TPA: glycosyltransferase [Planctomycetes bacterium]|nr:glycosyltransferase [Planctomycetota bacterium]HIL53367.1 glycosyltransferase [Planctomycetota bacterium]